MKYLTVISLFLFSFSSLGEGWWVTCLNSKVDQGSSIERCVEVNLDNVVAIYYYNKNENDAPDYVRIRFDLNDRTHIKCHISQFMEGRHCNVSDDSQEQKQ